MTLQQLKYMITVVNCNSISKAAKDLFISQPSLSAAIQELEKEMGVLIFTRTSGGVTLTTDGSEFLSYARQIVEQSELLEQRYLHRKPSKRIGSVSTQHYAFSVNAFSNLIAKQDIDEYEFALRETRTHEIIEDVKNLQSEIGVLYINDFNEKVIRKLLKENALTFHPLFEAEAHVFISSSHPLSTNEKISLSDLEPYPCLSYEQGNYNSFYFAEEMLSTISHKKDIIVSDRATLFNLLIGLNGYTICSGVLNSDLNGDNIIAVPLESQEKMLVGWIARTKASLSHFAIDYIAELKRVIAQYAILISEKEQ
jgi:DNA-binding transcriptional LysR family regulator